MVSAAHTTDVQHDALAQLVTQSEQTFTVEPATSIETTVGGGAELPTLELVTLLVEHQQRRLLEKMFGIESPLDHLSHYRIERMLGTGGMGEVYAARHVDSGELVALKTLSRASPRSLYRFKREFRALADVTHRNLIKLFELGVMANGRAFFTMEYIEGVPFVDWVRADVEPGEMPDLGRLAIAMIQLIEGVCHLHASGCVHRDLKPSNVLVTPDKRVVILDFGLISEIGTPEHGVTRDGQMLGTPAYMAPEQAQRLRVGPPADFYAIGVMLYACLTGKLPHSGPVLTVLDAKQKTLDETRVLRDVPRPLRELCLGLLQRDPKRRLDATALSEWLVIEPRDTSPLFLGRAAELAELHRCHDELLVTDEPIVVQLRGKTGQGKSSLLNRFCEQIRGAGSLTLRGLCRERETLPYKGFDAIVDALSAHLHRLPGHEIDALRPAAPQALGRVFPVLDDLWPSSKRDPISPKKLRSLSWKALREVLVATATKQPLVIVIDDFHWTDTDSLRLLEFILQPPNTPRMLLILGLCDGLGDAEALAQLSASDINSASARALELGPLAMHDARHLARAMLEKHHARAHNNATRADAIAFHAAGNPMLIAQLARGTGKIRADVRLDDLIRKRLDAINGPAHELLKFTAISGGPIDKALLRRLCPGASDSDFRRLMADDLLVENRSINDCESWLDVVHDKIRTIVVSEIQPAEMTRLHRELGRNLLAQHECTPTTDILFKIVDHLNRGYAESLTLDESSRLELARLNYDAGQRALRVASHTLANKYYQHAHDFVMLGLDTAQRLGERDALFMDIMFGRLCSAQSSDETKEIFDAVAQWALEPEEFERFCAKRAAWLAHHHSLGTSVLHCVDSLRKMGVCLPRRPSRLWASWNFELGRRALAGRRSTELTVMTEASDVSARGVANITAWAGPGIFTTNETTSLWGWGLIGVHARLTSKHGISNMTALGIAYMIITLLARGRSQQALKLYDTLRRCETKWTVPSASTARAWLEMMVLASTKDRASASTVP